MATFEEMLAQKRGQKPAVPGAPAPAPVPQASPPPKSFEEALVRKRSAPAAAEASTLPSPAGEGPLEQLRAFQQGPRGENVLENAARGAAGFIPTSFTDLLKMFSPAHQMEAAQQFGTAIGEAAGKKELGQFVKEHPVEVAAPILAAIPVFKGGKALIGKLRGGVGAAATGAVEAVEPKYLAPDPALPREFPEVKAPTSLAEVKTYAQEIRGTGGLAPEPNVIAESKTGRPVGETVPPRATEFREGAPPSTWIHLPEVETRRRVYGIMPENEIQRSLTPFGQAPEPNVLGESRLPPQIPVLPEFQPPKTPPASIRPLEPVAFPEPPTPEPLPTFEIERFPTFKPVQEAALEQRAKATETVRKVRKAVRSDPEGSKLARNQEREAQQFAEAPPGSLTPQRLAQMKEAKDFFLTAVSSRFRKWGMSGEKFAEKLERTEVASDRQIANDMVDWGKIFKGLSEQERVAVDQTMRGAPTSNPKVRAAAEQASQILADRYATPAEQLKLPVLNPATGQSRPFQRQANYAPQITTNRSIKKWAAPHERLQAIEQLRRVPRQYRGGGIQFSRTADIPGYERDPMVWGPMYFRRSAKRIAQAIEFGTGDEQAKQLLGDIQRTHGQDAGLKAAKLWASFIQPHRSEFSGLVGVLHDFATVSMLTTTGVMQAGQLSNTIAREGFLNTLKGLNRIRTKAGREAMERTGATVGSLVHDIAPDGHSIGAKWSGVIGLTEGDRANRLYSAAAAQFRAEQVARALARGKTSPGLMIDAKRLGFTREQAIRQKGTLTPDQLSNAAQRGANNTQFASRFIDLPEWRNSDMGRVLGLFKTFAIQSGRFSKDLIRDAKDGHWQPLLRFAGASATWNAALGEAIRKLKGNEAPDNPVWRYLEDIAYTISLGTFQDLVRAAAQGNKAVLEYFGGPIVGEGSRYFGEAGQALQGEPEELQRHLLQRTVKRVPFVGQQLYEDIAP